MKSQKLVIYILALHIFGCSNNYFVKIEKPHPDYKAQINYLGKNKSALITLEGGYPFEAENIKISNEYISYIIKHPYQTSNVPISQIKMISFNDHTVGLFYGIMMGFWIGAFYGAATIGNSHEMASLGVLAKGGVGLLVGSIYCGITGIDRNYIFIYEDEPR